MRHKKLGRRLHRSQSHRQALLKNLSKELIRYEQIKTTVPKAKELKRYVDKIITLGKKGGLHRRRQAFQLLRNQDLVNKVFDVLAERYKERAGGYSRLMKSGFRHGDNAPMAVIEFIDRDESAKPRGPKPSDLQTTDATASPDAMATAQESAEQNMMMQDETKSLVKQKGKGGGKKQTRQKTPATSKRIVAPSASNRSGRSGSGR